MAPPLFLSTSESLIACAPIPADGATFNRARHTLRTTVTVVNLILSLNIGVPWYPWYPWYQRPLFHLWSSINLVQAEPPFSIFAYKKSSTTAPPPPAAPPPSSSSVQSNASTRYSNSRVRVTGSCSTCDCRLLITAYSTVQLTGYRHMASKIRKTNSRHIIFLQTTDQEGSPFRKLLLIQWFLAAVIR